MKRLFSFLMVALFSVSMWANTYKITGNQSGWGAWVDMTTSTGGYYEYYVVTGKTINCKINKSASYDGACDESSITTSFYGTNITNTWSDGGNINFWDENPYYVLIFLPNTCINTTENPIVCASSTLPAEDFYVAGEADWMGTSWTTSGTANKMSLTSDVYSLTIKSVTAEAHPFKVSTIDWLASWGHSAYDGTNSKNVVSEADAGGNISFTPAMEGDVTVKFDRSTSKISIVCQTPVVTFDKEDGKGGTDSQNAEYGVAAANVTAPSKDYHDFAGYFDGDNGTGTQVINASGAWLQNVAGFTSDDATPKWAVRENKTLHAKWTGKAYAITYKDKGDVAYSGSNAASLPATYTYGEGINPLPNGAKDDYTFDGWFSTPACDGDPVTAISASASGAMTLYAKWTEIVGGSVQLTAGEGGQVSKDNTNWNTSATITDIKANQEVNIYAKANTGYSFEAWTKTSGTGSVKTNEAAGVYNAIAYSAEAVTASFTENKVAIVPTVHFDAGSATYTATATVGEIGIETESVLTTSAATTGFTFEGWELSDNLVVVSGDKSKDLSITVRTNGDGAAVSAVANYHEDLSTNYVLKGDSVFGGKPTYWNQDLPLLKKTGHSAESVAYLTVNITEPVGEGDDYRYNFKIVENGSTWWGVKSDGYYWYDRSKGELPMITEGGENIQIRADKAGAYEIKVDFSGEQPTINISFPEQIKSAVTISNPAHGNVSVKKGETPVASGSDVEELTELTISASADEGYEVTALRAYKTDGEEPEAINEGKLIMPAYAITVTADIEQKGKYYISGDSAFVVDAGLGLSQMWNPKAIKATENVLVIKNLKVGVPYQIALTEDGDWSTKKNYNDLTAKPACLRDEDGDNHNIGFTLKTAGDVTVTYTGSVFTVKGDFVMPTLALAGTFSEWSQLPMNIAADSLSASIAVNLTAGVDSFKIVKDGAWLSLNGEGETNYRVNRDWPQAPHVNLVNVGRNFVIDVDKAGEYIFKWTYSEDSLFVTFPELENKAVSITNLKYGSITVKNGEASVASGDNIQENTILTVTAASNSDVDYEVSNLRAFKTGDESTKVEINESTHQLTMPGYAITITADERVNSYIMAGSLALFGAEWDATAEANKMTKDSEHGTYQLVKKEVALTAGETYDYKLTRNEEYILPAEGNYHLTNVLRSGEYTLTFTYIPSSNSVTLDTVLTKEEEVVPVVSIATEVNKWSVTADQLVISGDKKTASKVIELTEGVHVFKVVKGIWLGKENMTVTRAANTSIDFSKDNKDTEIYIWADVTGEYTFTWTYETSQLDITYPAAPSPASAWLLLGENVGGEGETWQTLVLTKAGDGKSASIGVDLKKKTDYEFKFIIGNEYRSIADEGKYTFHRGNKVAAGAASDNNNMLLQADWTGEYTFTWTYSTNGISIGFPDEPAIDYYIAGSFTEPKWFDGKQPMVNEGDFWSASFNLEALTKYQFQVVAIQDSEVTWYGAQNADNEMKYGQSSNWELVAEGHDINLTTTNQTSYPFYFVPNGKKISVTINQYVPTGVDNAEATVKAVKTLENGMLIIEKNGVRYNAQGQVIK